MPKNDGVSSSVVNGSSGRTDIDRGSLRLCGFKRMVDAAGMAMDLARLPDDWALPSGVKVTEAHTPSEDRWNDVLCRAYPMPIELATLFSSPADPALAVRSPLAVPITPEALVCVTHDACPTYPANRSVI